MTNETEVVRLFSQDLPRSFGDTTINALVHSIAFAPRESLKDGDAAQGLLRTSPDSFSIAHLASSYSLLSLVRHGIPFMSNGCSVVTLSYLGNCCMRFAEVVMIKCRCSSGCAKL
jgi:enoyl-[acyl-carrier protein] reductase I